MRVTVLGCGGSQGVPMIGGIWGACDPENPKNRRTRASIFLEWDGVHILVDTSPDLREQLLRAEITHLDAVLFTHAHADHVHGIDDLRGLQRLGDRPRIEAFAESGTLDEIVTRFPYLFLGALGSDRTYPPFLIPQAIDGPFEVVGKTVVPFRQIHGNISTTGFRFGPFAYTTDAAALPEESLQALEGIDTWVVDCLRLGPDHPTHAHWPLTKSWLDRIKPRRAILTHMNHQCDYTDLDNATPDNVTPAFDGLTIDIP